MQDATLDSDPLPPCPRRSRGPVVRNGPNPSGTPTFRCRGCGRRFVARPKAGPVPEATHVVTAVRVLDKDSADAPQFTPLVKETAEGFTIDEV